MPKTAIHHKIMRIRNITSGIDIKLSQAQRRVGECTSYWVREGYSIRDYKTLQEVIAARGARGARAAREQQSRGLVYYIEGKDGKLIEKPYLAELYEVTVKNLPHLYEERQLAQEANKFCQECAA